MALDCRLYLIAFVALFTTGCSLGIQDIPLETLKQKYADNTSRFIDIDGLAVHYRDEGLQSPDAPTLLLLHGVCSSLHTWDGWVTALKDHYRIVRLDLPGLGLTGPADHARYDVETYMHFLLVFTGDLGLRHTHIAGSSLGGFFAWNYAARYPDRVNKLILVDPAGYPLKLPWALAPAANPLTAPIFERLTPRMIVALTLRDIYGDDDKITPALIDRYHELMLRPGNRRAIVDGIPVLSQFDPTRVKEVEAPTLVLWGEEDTWIPLKHADLFMRDLKHATLITYPGAGHIPMEEIPVATAADADRFIRDKASNN